MEKAIVPPEKKPYQEIGDDLRAQIAQGRYPVGSRLPPERHIAETYGVSRTIVREALLMLELQGTVDIRQGSGVYVMRIPHENDSEEEQLLSSDVGPFEILQARQLLESNIAAFAAKMATRADIDNLKRIIEQEQRAIALNDTAQDNARLFHLVLAGATQNQMLLATVERIWLQMDSSPLWQQFNVHIASRAWRLKWLGDRQTLLAALRRPHAVLLGALIAVVDALPVLGSGTVLLPWAAVSLLRGSGGLALGLTVTYAAAAFARSALEPRLLGRQIGLPPLLTLLSLYAGYRLFGLAGMILLPLAVLLAKQVWELAEGNGGGIDGAL